MDIALVTGLVESSTPGFSEDFSAFTARVDVPLVAALEARGAHVHRPNWRDPDVAWEDFDLALVRTTWDYTQRRDEFVAWAVRTGARTRLWNPPDVLRWNSHKSYLLELEERGAPVVPTAWSGQGDHIDLAALLERRGWTHAVVKPAIASGSRGMARVVRRPEDAHGPAGGGELDLARGQAHLDDLLAAGDALVQPFLRSVVERGELSVVLVDGEVSHAVRKTPRAGDFRIQETYGGRYRREEIAIETAALARWIVAATGVELFIARVDLLEDDLGTLQLAELEVTEPDLYLGAAPDAAGPIADAVLRRARS